MMRILVPSLTSIDLDLVKDALGQLAVTVTMISSCSQTYLFFFFFLLGYSSTLYSPISTIPFQNQVPLMNRYCVFTNSSRR